MILFQPKTLLILTVVLILACSKQAVAQDWGYNGYSQSGTANSVKELEAKPQSLNFAPVNRDKAFKQKLLAPPKVKATSSAMPQGGGSAEYAWLQIFGICQPLGDKTKLPQGPDFASNFTKVQKSRFLGYIKEMIRQDPDGFGAINYYWPELSMALKVEDHLDNYRLLFRSLLRMIADDPKTPQLEKQILLEVLGPAMIAIKKDPTLSAEAIEAYSDMACFLYEQTHPGKTVDADDNRKLFALVIKDKFNKAPAYADRLAMSYFPINWAKFRILYIDANDAERRILVEKLAKKGKSGGPVVRNALLEKVLTHNPWKATILAAKKRTKLVGLKAKVKALKLGDLE